MRLSTQAVNYSAKKMYLVIDVSHLTAPLDANFIAEDPWTVYSALISWWERNDFNTIPHVRVLSRIRQLNHSPIYNLRQARR